MSLTITVVHAPGALDTGHWAALHRAAGRMPHELRLSLTGLRSPDGAQLRAAVLEWAAGHLPSDARSRLAALQTHSAGTPLAELPSESPQIHPGMVVVLAPQRPSTAPRAPRSRTAGLRLCIDQGPDAGRLLPLTRGTRGIGRAAEITVADPALGREQLRLSIGERGIRIREQGRSLPWTSGEPLTRGRSTFELLRGPAPASGGRWPTAPQAVDGEPPEGKHRMMLVMALVPLVAGIVLVTVTGMWFFLLFSAASALVALGTVIDATRRRRRYRRALQQAAAEWARRRSLALPTPGRVSRLLREGAAPSMPDATVRLGSAQVPAQLELATSASPPETLTRTGAALNLHPGLQTLIRGHRREVDRLFRWILLQLLIRPSRNRPPLLVCDAGLRLPAELEDLEQVRLLAAAELTEDTLPAAVSEGPAGVLLASGGLGTPLAERAAARGWHVLTSPPNTSEDERGLLTSREDLQLVDLSAGAVTPGSSSGRRPRGDGEPHEDDTTDRAQELVADGLSSQTTAELLRLALPHCTDGGGAPGLPRQHDASLPDPLMARSARRSLIAELGRGADSAELLDLVNDGPHILLAGTSGSGKSELLKSLMLGWAAAYGPEEVNFVLFDFKGGSTFQTIDQLEHSLGLVTDLSQAQAERTLEGIRSELTRRERLFLETGAGDYSEYRRLAPERPLARMLVVIDEFRIFSHELPDTMDELMRLATLGRSLGLHLVLATQRPQGVVTPDIRANIGAVITLRLRGDDESQDLVGTAEAGRIPRDLPGRGIVRRPGEAPVPFQSARLSSGSEVLRAAPASARVHAAGPADWEDSSPQIVRRLAGAEHTRSRPHTPLLPALPKDVPVSHDGSDPMLAMVDDPARQDQWPLRVHPRAPQSLALIGEGGSGGAQALRSLTAQLLAGDEPVHVYLLDGDRSLEQFRDHPRVGSWITEEHMPELDHLLAALKEELALRRISRERARTPLIVLMSGHAQWHMAAQSSGPGMMDHALGTLISEGDGVGISAVLSGGRELVSGKLGARIPARIYLPYGVSTDTSFMWPKLRPVDALPGRGVLIDPHHPAPGLEVQLVSAAEAETPPRGDGPPREPPVRVHPLPEELPATSLPGSAEERKGPGACPVIGVAQFTHGPVALELGAVTLILGARAMGKSSALRLLDQQLSGRARWWEQLESGAQELESGGDRLPEILLIDDADRLGPTEHQRVEQLLLRGVRVVAAAAPGPSVFGTIPWAHRARGGPGNMLLSPTHRSQGDAFAMSVPVLSRPVPGRAVLLRPENPMVVQWAVPTSSGHIQ
ncbi:FtsK/SpoIIIE domain-containing protein [Nesterenkonia lacusekhoensis]|uniref:S-DNA-T family DNA segregation ATPase FtsK/SpoIIIE n=1 Tax=Nesterenkonia lacusekhoensis TaxID=150832 RepID=A0ABS4T1Y9_9MICC|nr:FtsK/SpoIIIE domain-containing protein [Nesterenkonia lacusekhoensis]MBP2318472.1 S-DNA-T family DNA segregation ATPase FtsK/SpoIIIE [Nesterenkonia lacusekhoensis]